MNDQTPINCCPNEACGAQLNGRHVFVNERTEFGVKRQTALAWCDKCSTGWRRVRVLRGGVWQDEADASQPGRAAPAVKQLTGKALAGLKARVDNEDNVRRAESA
jgi:hypothetical protein